MKDAHKPEACKHHSFATGNDMLAGLKLWIHMRIP
jgi:hypothetical protein